MHYNIKDGLENVCKKRNIRFGEISLKCTAKIQDGIIVDYSEEEYYSIKEERKK